MTNSTRTLNIQLPDANSVKARIPTKGFDSKAAKIAARLTIEASSSLTCFCSVTGLTVSTDLPPSFDFTLATLHPMAFNGRKLLAQPDYIRSLNNAQLAGLILSLLAEADKITIPANSNAYLVRAKLETICSKNKLLDIIEWIANSLLVTRLYYPKLTAHHSDLSLESLDEYMEWTYSIETYSFGGSAFEPSRDLEDFERKTKVKAPKRLKLESLDSKIKRLNKSFNSSLAELSALLLESKQTTIPAQLAANLRKVLKDKVDEPNPKIDNMLSAALVEPDLADCIQDLIDLRAAAKAARSEHGTNLDALLQTIDSVEPSQPTPVAEQPKAEAKAPSFAERLAQVKARAAAQLVQTKGA